MITITLARKPLTAGTVAANVLEHGTGALNINGSRIHTSNNLNSGAYSAGGAERHDGADNLRYKHGEHGGLAGKEFTPPQGRWPANIILEHQPECVRVGTMNTETVKSWVCGHGCPITDLDEQSFARGIHSSGSSGSARPSNGGFGVVPLEGRFLGGLGTGDYGSGRIGDDGGASRFFKILGGTRS